MFARWASDHGQVELLAARENVLAQADQQGARQVGAPRELVGLGGVHRGAHLERDLAIRVLERQRPLDVLGVSRYAEGDLCQPSQGKRLRQQSILSHPLGEVHGAIEMERGPGDVTHPARHQSRGGLELRRQAGVVADAAERLLEEAARSTEPLR